MMTESETKRFFLTFDGAPDARGTDKILERLAAHDVKATFFMEGSRIDRDPAGARRVLAAGHAVGNHSYSHPNFSELTLAECEEEVFRADAAIRRHLELETTLLRPPFGKIAAETVGHFERLGFKIVLWDYSIRDWEGPDAAAIAERVLSQLHEDEAIVVMHDYVEWNPDVIDIIVPAIRARGYAFHKVSAQD